MAVRAESGPLVPMYQHILFDLDGTLIDSADAILEGFRRVVHDLGLTPLRPIDRRLIGPPLRQTLSSLTGIDDPEQLAHMAQRFSDWYDAEGYRGTTVYPGIAELLATLHAHGARLHVVTNKRLRPTRLILDWLGWRSYFERIDTQDMRADAPLTSKSAVLGRLLDELAIHHSEAIYVGDRLDDVQAAADHGLPCVTVGWGYGAADAIPPDGLRAASPAALGALLGLA